jgi:type 1 glutamine amidotransferase
LIRDSAPRSALAKPKKARRLLVIDLCPQGGFYHRTIPYANFALETMAKNTGAFEPIFDNDLDNLKYPEIKDYDAIFLNSVVGPVFSDPDVLDGLIRYVREGGGLAAIHGTTFASTEIPEFGELMGATSGPHRAFESAMLKIEDPDSPIVKQFEGHDFAHVDELYHFPATGPYSRDKLHILVSINLAKSGPPEPSMQVRPDNDYGLVWVKSEGKGRVFNCALGHSSLLFGTPQLSQMVFAGIQFALGDLETDTTPSAKLGKR